MQETVTWVQEKSKVEREFVRLCNRHKRTDIRKGPSREVLTVFPGRRFPGTKMAGCRNHLGT